MWLKQERLCAGLWSILPDFTDSTWVNVGKIFLGSDLYGQIKFLSNSHAGYQGGAGLYRAKKQLLYHVKSVLRRASVTGTQQSYSRPGPARRVHSSLTPWILTLCSCVYDDIFNVLMTLFQLFPTFWLCDGLKESFLSLTTKPLCLCIL